MAARKSNKAKGRKGDNGESRESRSIWRGSISFGLINIPCRLYSAVQEKNVRFHMFSGDKNHCRVRQKLVCEGTNKEVERRNVVKGYPVAAGKHVIVTNEELDRVAPKSSRTIDLIQFADWKEIDPLFFSRSYYLLPEPMARKAYALFISALEKSGKVGIAKLTMHKREYLVTLRPVDHAVCLQTMHFSDEVRQVHNLPESDQDVKINSKELQMAEQLIGSLSDHFDAGKFQDEYRQRVLDLIKQKEKGKKVVISEEPEEEGAEIVDLTSALEASLKKAKKSRAA